MASGAMILVVDDDLPICELIRLYLEKDGFRVTLSHDGRKAVEVFKETAPDLVVLDIMLPGIDGWQVCREIRRFSQIPIIMLSARDETFNKVLGLELGADDYMVKPFEPNELSARIRAVLRRYERREEPQIAAGVSGPDHQQGQLYSHTQWTGTGIAAQGVGVALLSCLQSKQGIHPRTVA